MAKVSVTVNMDSRMKELIDQFCAMSEKVCIFAPSFPIQPKPLRERRDCGRERQDI